GVEISAPSLKQPLRFANGHVKVKGRSAESRFTLTLGPMHAHGQVKIANLQKPRADFTIVIQELNVAELSALVVGGKQGPKSSRSSGRALRRLLARGTVQVDKVVMEQFTAENVKGTVRLYTHKLTVDPLEVDFYGGRVEGSLSTDLEKESLPSTLTVTVQGVDVAKLASAAQQGAESKVTGTFDADASLRTALGADPLAALTGQGNFSVRDGMLKGFKLEGKRAAMASLLQIEVPSGDTPFRLFAGDLRIQQQRVHSQKVSLDADAMQGELSGSFGFDGTLDYRGTGVLGGGGGAQQEQPTDEQPRSRYPRAALGRAFGKVMRQTVGRMRVPISVTGTFAQPRFRLAGVPEPIEQAQDQTQATQPEPPPDQRKSLLNLFKRRP
ncbi:MAG: AsmA-like C-terminal region-containing protein, partial [Lysobacteraceae bacterium]